MDILAQNTQLGYEETILVNSTYFTALCQDLDKAQFNIDLSTYIFKPGKIANKISETLIKAAQRGVEVRLLIDGLGSRFCDANYIRTLSHQGVQVRIYHPLPWRLWQWNNTHPLKLPFLFKVFYFFARINRRNHQKFSLIDNSIIYIGSANIDDVHLSEAEGGAAWRDTTVRIKGANTTVLRAAFNIVWYRLRLRRKLKKLFNDLVIASRFNINLFKRQRKNYYNLLLSLLKKSQKRIWITSPYFLPNNRLLKTFQQAAKRGVDIKILLPAESDVVISTWVANTFYSALLKSGVEIYEYVPNILHAKLLIIDDNFFVGSSNLNTRSLKHDLEIDVALQTTSAKVDLTQQFFQDIKASKQIFLSDMKKQTWVKRSLGKILLILRYWI